MTNPVVLITRPDGIGRATALAFAHEALGLSFRASRGRGLALVAELRTLGADAEFIRADVRHEDDVRNLVDKTVAPRRLDVAVNNAGTEARPAQSPNRRSDYAPPSTPTCSAALEHEA